LWIKPDMATIPYSRQSISDDDIAAVVAVLKSDFLTQGPEIAKFESAIAALHGAAHGVAVCNATAALHIACLALDVGPGDIIWTSPNSFVASANCGRYCGADVDFVDIDPVTRNMSVEALATKLSDAKAAGTLPKVVIPVDFAGFPCDMAGIRALADDYGFKIIEDASHAVGASVNGVPVGNHADICVFSFHPVKIITTGEGGICVTNDPAIAQRLMLLRSHGVTRDPALMENETDGPWYYEQVSLGLNYRLTDLQAALGTTQLKRIAALYEAREAFAQRYDAALSGGRYKLPARTPGVVSAHHLYVIEVDELAGGNRRALYDHLRAADIAPNVHYYPIHMQPYYQRLGFSAGMFPHAERYYRQAITLPLYPEMTEESQDRVIAALHAAP
jgi:UDP-4-amino-4,6-dideoxy-N-acetyl-beta-L-altrosamine transaminase